VPQSGQALFGPTVALARAAAAVNAAGPPAQPASLAEPFAAVLRASGEPGSLAGIEAQADALAAVLEQLYDIFAAPDTAAAARSLNAALARHTGPLRLVEEPGAAWHMHAEDPGKETWATWFAASSLVAMAVHFAERGAPAWGICAARGCRNVYVQTGPGRPRTTCSAACANRHRQAELRARRRMGRATEPAASPASALEYGGH
jgi:CGNR zinc finger